MAKTYKCANSNDFFDLKFCMECVNQNAFIVTETF